MGIDLPNHHKKKRTRTSPTGEDVYMRLLVKVCVSCLRLSLLS
jgi:hypothetical protein